MDNNEPEYSRGFCTGLFLCLSGLALWIFLIGWMLYVAYRGFMAP